jgi:amino acid transporter
MKSLFLGVVVIAGTCAAVNVLVHAVPRIIIRMADYRLLPAVFKRFTSRPIEPLFCLPGNIGLLMAKLIYTSFI